MWVINQAPRYSNASKYINTCWLRFSNFVHCNSNTSKAFNNSEIENLDVSYDTWLRSFVMFHPHSGVLTVSLYSPAWKKANDTVICTHIQTSLRTILLADPVFYQTGCSIRQKHIFQVSVPVGCREYRRFRRRPLTHPHVTTKISYVSNKYKNKSAFSTGGPNE